MAPCGVCVVLLPQSRVLAMVVNRELCLPSVVEMEAVAKKDADMWDQRFKHDATRLKGGGKGGSSRPLGGGAALLLMRCCCLWWLCRSGGLPGVHGRPGQAHGRHAQPHRHPLPVGRDHPPPLTHSLTTDRPAAHCC